ncbi:MAG: TauD/TfdA family dioxygenase [Pseudomonadota bacterium]
MTIELHSLGPGIGAEARGVDASAALGPKMVDALEAAMDRYAVLVLRGQRLTDEQQLRFTRYFGDLQEGANTTVSRGALRLDPAFADVSNVGIDGALIARDSRRRMASLGNRLWHSDASFRVVPARYSLLSARSVPPEGGNTEFADMRAAYAALPEQQKAALSDLVCEHSQLYSRAQLGFTEFTDDEIEVMRPVLQRLIREHPSTGQKSLFLSAHIGTVVGWLRPEAMAFIRDLMEHATQREFVYIHAWQPDDLVIWDNRCTMHRVRSFDDLTHRRDMRRTTTRGEGPTVSQ